MHPVLATEIEFYLVGAKDNTLEKLQVFLAGKDFDIFAVEKERADEQYEVSLNPTRDILKLADETERLKISVAAFAAEQGLEAIFAAKPFEGRAGSGLHIHLHLENEAGENLFTYHNDTYSDYLMYSIAGLLKDLPASMPIFAPNATDALRYKAGGVQTPTHICWGVNNRSAAIRLPNKPAAHKHIEHRVPSPAAPVLPVLTQMLESVLRGLEAKELPPPALYGLAADPQYQLVSLLSV